MDLVVIGLSWVAVSFSIYRVLKVSEILQKTLKNQLAFANFGMLAFYQTAFNNILAITGEAFL